MADKADESFLMIGLPNAGKTSLVGCLELATLREQRKNRARFNIFPENDDTIKLFAMARDTIRSGRLPFTASDDITDRAFSLEIHDVGVRRFVSALRGQDARKVQFNVPDAAGGIVFSFGDEKDHPDLERMLELAKVASGIVICVDPLNSSATGLGMFLDLPNFLPRIDLRPLPWRRVVVVLTKADQYFLRHGREAKMRALSESPIEHGIKLMTKTGIRSLKNYLPRQAALGFCWTSGYGFEGGASNYDETRNGLRHFPWEANGPTIEEVIDVWEPFQVLDPFLFLATGQAPGVKLLRD